MCPARSLVKHVMGNPNLSPCSCLNLRILLRCLRTRCLHLAGNSERNLPTNLNFLFILPLARGTAALLQGKSVWTADNINFLHIGFDGVFVNYFCGIIRFAFHFDRINIILKQILPSSAVNSRLYESICTTFHEFLLQAPTPIHPCNAIRRT